MDFLKKLFGASVERPVTPQNQSSIPLLVIDKSGRVTDITQVKELVDKGVLKKRQGDYRGAKELYRKAIQIDPDQRMSYYSLAKVCYLLREKDESVVNYLRSAHFSIPALVKLISCTPESKRNFEEQFSQLPSDVRSKYQATHKYAPYLLADLDTPCHIAHAVLDLESILPLPSELTRHAEVYKQALAGKRNDLDYSIEDQFYRPFGLDFLLKNLKWDKMGDRNVLSIYPEPRPSPGK